jgi:signal transduction histidine kinase
VRVRLVIIFTIPIVVLFIFLGAAYARSVSFAGQQEVSLDRLSDTSHFVASARQAMAVDDPRSINSELTRYHQVYGIEAAVLDPLGQAWASNGLDVDALDESATLAVHSALNGRRSELSMSAVPWNFGPLIVAEPIFEGGDLIGVVVTSSDTERLAREVIQQWLFLAGLGVVVVAASVLLASRMANWVLRPVKMVDDAMTEIWHGHMEARISESTGPPELQQVLTVFNSMAEEVERLIHKQQEFVSNASHELRNPLNALMLRVEHLGLSVPEELDEDVEKAREEGRRMTRIIEALLMLAKGQDAKAAAEPLDIVPVVAHRVEAWQVIAAERGLTIKLSKSPPTWCPVDEIVIESAFDAVIDNAVKFSPDGADVDVSVSRSADVVEIVVRDHGPGIELEDIERATDRFWRNTGNQNVPGSGLGLAIATEFLTACGGELRIEPAHGGGLAVALVIPTVMEKT